MKLQTNGPGTIKWFPQPLVPLWWKGNSIGNWTEEAEFQPNFAKILDFIFSNSSNWTKEFWGKKPRIQECILVGWVPSTVVAVSGGGVCLWGCLPRNTRLTEWLTDRCKNIIFPQLLLRTVKMYTHEKTWMKSVIHIDNGFHHNCSYTCTSVLHGSCGHIHLRCDSKTWRTLNEVSWLSFLWKATTSVEQKNLNFL